MQEIVNTEVNLLDQIATAFNAMLSDNRFTFPEYTTTFTLALGEPSRELRIMFESLKFNVIRISNRTANGNKLLLDPATASRSFTYKALTRRFARDSNMHPTDINKGGLLIISPKNGGQLIGPIDGTDHHHHCFTDYILAGLARSGYSLNLPFNQGRTQEELDDEWRTNYGYRCRTTCPRPHAPLFLPEDGESDDDERDIFEALSTQPLMTQRERSSGPRRSNHITPASELTPPSTSTTLSPLVQLLEVTGPAPFPMDPPSPSLQNRAPLPSHDSTSARGQPTLPFIQPGALELPTTRLTSQVPAYVMPAGEPEFSSFEQFHEHLIATRYLTDILNENIFKVEGDSVPDATAALVAALMNVYSKEDTALCAEPLQQTLGHFTGFIRPIDTTVRQIFSFEHWLFRGGLRGDDTSGGGVMRQILLEAVQLASEGIVEDLDNGDGYVSLKISADRMVSDKTLDRCFALGALCTIFMVKAYAAPEPISPALIQAAIGTHYSIQERRWIRSISPPVAETLDLLPTPVNFRHPIPDHPKLRSMVRSKFPGTSYDAVLGTQGELNRVKLNRVFFTKVLLGMSEADIDSAPEYLAFCDGINRYLTPAIPSFKAVIGQSSKFLLAKCYSRRVTSPEQLIPHLEFNYHRSNTPTVVPDTEHFMPQIKLAVKRYLRGTGHPEKARELCDPLTYDDENMDPALRARRFVKVLSGLEMMPVRDRTFTVSVYQDIPDRALFRGQYKANEHLIPPYTHGCLFEIDVWLNQPLIDSLATAEAPLGEDTDFDWMMHMGVMKMGLDTFQTGP
ncbi:hypothetical protein GALMADRAFT_229037 [Galerina marginata CBS 339.88]|uniref:Uncharacterized protein n=1 Tax=Galerina marginata (strain CBS 339.88) TaxID=685588 RepID=A0A067SZI3_GALM3|nr:hypothetical protein GALMADRAFT_229037 [Galerina marginata CBS 339.88]